FKAIVSFIEFESTKPHADRGRRALLGFRDSTPVSLEGKHTTITAFPVLIGREEHDRIAVSPDSATLLVLEDETFGGDSRTSNRKIEGNETDPRLPVETELLL